MTEWQNVDVADVAATPADLELTAALNRQAPGALTVQWLPDGCHVESTSWVGVVRFSDFEVHIRPKAAGGDLAILEMLDFTDGLDSVRRLPNVHQLEDEGTSLADLVCWLLAEEAGRLLRHGLLSDYVAHEEPLGVLRGRLQLQTQMRRYFGRVDVLECRFDEYEGDILENRIVAQALRSARLICRNSNVRRLVAQVEPIFSEVCATEIADPVEAHRVLAYNRRNNHYRAAHHWAFLLLGGHAVRDLYASTGPTSFAFMLDMNSLFERFIARVVADDPLMQHLSVRIQAHSPKLIVRVDGSNYSTLIPDMLVSRPGATQWAFPLDTKYKLYDHRPVDQSDLYQLFVYAYAFAAGSMRPEAMLIYPSDVGSAAFSLRLRAGAFNMEPELHVVGVSLPRMLERIRDGGRPGQALTERIVQPFE